MAVVYTRVDTLNVAALNRVANTFPYKYPFTYKFPKNDPSLLEMRFPTRRFAFVLRTFDATITLAGGQVSPLTVKVPPPNSDPLYLGGPFAMLSHISYCFFIKIIESNPISKTTIIM